MRIVLMIYCSLVYLSSCGQEPNNSFIEKIVADFSRNSFYILLNVESSGKRYLYLIQNDDLFYYYHQKNGFNEAQYQEFIKPIINGRRTIAVSKEDLKKYEFTLIWSSRSVNDEAKKGKVSFLKKYFDRRALKDGISDEDRLNIIATLFKWNIASGIDCESGYLIYSE